MALTTKTLNTVSLLVLAALLTGCAAPRAVVGTHSKTAELEIESGAGRIAILEPEVLLYDVSAGGVLEYRTDWSQIASKQTARSAALTLKREGYSPLLIPDPARAREIFMLKTALRYHSAAFMSDFFVRIPFDSYNAVFSIGPIHELCDRYGVDAFLYVYGYEENFSDGRRALLNERSEAVPAERTFMAAVLADRDGRILVHRHMMVPGNFDMRREADSMRIMRALLGW